MVETHSDISRSSQCSTAGIKRQWHVLSCLWDGAYKIVLATPSERVAHEMAAAIFPMSDAI